MGDLVPISYGDVESAIGVATDVCTVARETFDAGLTGAAGMRSAVRRIDVALASWNASVASGASAAGRQATTKEIAGALAMLLKAIPKSKDEDRTDFGKYLFEDVVWAKPTIGGLTAGCFALRRTKKFTPSIAEVLESIKAAEDPLRAAPLRVEELKIRREELAAQIADAERRAAVLADARARVADGRSI